MDRRRRFPSEHIHRIRLRKQEGWVCNVGLDGLMKHCTLKDPPSGGAFHLNLLGTTVYTDTAGYLLHQASSPTRSLTY